MRIASSQRRLAPMARGLLLGLLLAAALLSIASPARASTGGTIIDRCIHGQPLSGFSQQAYREALANLPTEVEEYSDCANLIRRAELSAAGGAGGAGEPAAATAPIPLSPAERRALNNVPKVGSAPLRVGNQVVRPGVAHVNIASALNSLPSPLIALLALLFACALLLAGRAIRDRVRAHRAR